MLVQAQGALDEMRCVSSLHQVFFWLFFDVESESSVLVFMWFLDSIHPTSMTLCAIRDQLLDTEALLTEQTASNFDRPNFAYSLIEALYRHGGMVRLKKLKGLDYFKSVLSVMGHIARSATLVASRGNRMEWPQTCDLVF